MSFSLPTPPPPSLSSFKQKISEPTSDGAPVKEKETGKKEENENEKQKGTEEEKDEETKSNEPSLSDSSSKLNNDEESVEGSQEIQLSMAVNMIDPTKEVHSIILKFLLYLFDSCARFVVHTCNYSTHGFFVHIFIFIFIFQFNACRR